MCMNPTADINWSVTHSNQAELSFFLFIRRSDHASSDQIAYYGQHLLNMTSYMWPMYLPKVLDHKRSWGFILNYIKRGFFCNL